MKEGSRVRIARSHQGLEVSIATPWALSGHLVGLAILLFMGAFAVTVVTEHLTGALPDYLLILERLFGRWWLWAGIAVLALLIALDRQSTERTVLGPRLVERQTRTGRFVLGRDRFPLSWVSDPEVEELQGKHYVTWRWTRGLRTRSRVIGEGLSRAEAEEVAARVREWLQSAPAAMEATAEAREPSAGAALLDSAVSLVTSRFGLALPALLAAGSLVYQELAAGDEGFARELVVVEGELEELRWVLDPATAYDSISMRIGMEAAIRFRDGERVQTRWLASRAIEPRYVLDERMLQAAAVFGSPPVRFVVPARTLGKAPAGSDWLDWAEWRWGRRGEEREWPPHELYSLTMLDDPYTYLAVRYSTPEPDLRVAYPAGRPDQAMPLVWWQAEHEARGGVSPAVLVPSSAAALLLLFATLPRVLVRARHHRWLGTACVAALVLALPWWAAHADRLPRWLGADASVAEAMADLLRFHAEERGHLFFRPTAEPWTREPILEWTPDRSGAYPLMVTLGLHEPPAGLPLPSVEAVTAALVARATGAFAAMDDRELRAFAIDYGHHNPTERYRGLHWEVVRPAFCTQRPRLGTGFNYERWIDLSFDCAGE
jgi:hypothetical protein